MPSIRSVLEKELVETYQSLEDDINEAAGSEEGSYLDINVRNNIEYIDALEIIGPYFVHNFMKKVKGELPLDFN